MANPYLPIVAFTGSFTVQNRTDAGGTLATYVAFRNVQNSQFQLANTETPTVVFQLDRALLTTLTASLSSAYASTATGSF